MVPILKRKATSINCFSKGCIFQQQQQKLFNILVVGPGGTIFFSYGQGMITIAISKISCLLPAVGKEMSKIDVKITINGHIPVDDSIIQNPPIHP